jgi:squalene synthase HpnC
VVSGSVAAPVDAVTLARAYQACERMARAHYENFPVASWLLPAAMRPHVAAVYAFARTADDMADEGTATAADRQDRLRDWQRRLHQAADGGAPHDDLTFVALGHTIRSRNLSTELLDDLLSAFAQDTTTTRYASWSELYDYCRRSANPVGRLVLQIAGYRDKALETASDALCTALQLTNFWQDFGRDWRQGRMYVPAEVQARAGASLDDLAAGRWTPAWQQALASCVDVTREWFDRGRPVCDGVSGRLRLELRLTWLGGRSMLTRVAANVNPLEVRPTLGAGDLPALLWRAARWAPAVA